jgi:hypothetical protein
MRVIKPMSIILTKSRSFKQSNRAVIFAIGFGKISECLELIQIGGRTSFIIQGTSGRTQLTDPAHATCLNEDWQS